MHFHMPSVSVNPSQVWWSASTLALKSQRKISFFERDVIELVKWLSGVPSNLDLQASVSEAGNCLGHLFAFACEEGE